MVGWPYHCGSITSPEGCQRELEKWKGEKLMSQGKDSLKIGKKTLKNWSDTKVITHRLPQSDQWPASLWAMAILEHLSLALPILLLSMTFMVWKVSFIMSSLCPLPNFYLLPKECDANELSHLGEFLSSLKFHYLKHYWGCTLDFKMRVHF